MMINKQQLSEESAKLGVILSNEQLDQFDEFAEMLIETNKQFNLTAIKDPDEIVVKHFADSISLLSVIDIPQGAKIIDVGTGAGFPGVPLLIARPDLNMTLLDSTGKKLAFVSDSLIKLDLKADVIHARAEELGRDSYREKYDFCCSRAVAALNVLCEFCLPFLKVGGIFAAMKGAKADEELGLSRTAIRTLGGKFIGSRPLDLSDGAQRSIILIEKNTSTPPKYPRPSAQISKKPL